jgi:hypothetical protein
MGDKLRNTGSVTPMRPPASRQVALFGPFELDLKAGELHRDGHALRLQEQPDSGTVVGLATPQGDLALIAFVWKHGAISNLGVLPGNGCSGATATNSKGQIVGGSGFNVADFFADCDDPWRTDVQTTAESTDQRHLSHSDRHLHGVYRQGRCCCDCHRVIGWPLGAAATSAAGWKQK